MRLNPAEIVQSSIWYLNPPITSSLLFPLVMDTIYLLLLASVIRFLSSCLPILLSSTFFAFMRFGVNFLKQTFIVEEIERFSTSRSKKIYSAKKFYLHDTGLLNNLSSKFNLGSAAENILYKFLSISFKVNFYYENQHEIDFVFLNDNKKSVLVESKFIDKFDELSNGVLSSIENSAIDLKINRVFVITRSLEKEHIYNDITVVFIPLSKLLLSNPKEFFNEFF